MGFSAEHVTDLGLGDATDDRIEKAAREMQAVIWSKHADFARRAGGTPRLQVVWLRFGNTSNAALQARLAHYLPGIVDALANGEVPIEVR